MRAVKVYSAVRQAKQLESQRRIEIVAAGRSVVQGVTAAWNYVIASREAILGQGTGRSCWQKR
jgi:hypothetical protein